MSPEVFTDPLISSSNVRGKGLLLCGWLKCVLVNYVLKLNLDKCSHCCLESRLGHISSVFVCSPVWLIFQLEEVRGVPASSEKAISEATACKEELEKQKVKEEKKLEEVMESLKEETSGLQQDKEVCV